MTVVSRAVIAIDLRNELRRDELEERRRAGRGGGIHIANPVDVRDAHDEHFRDSSGAGEQIHRSAHVLEMLFAFQNEHDRIAGAAGVVIRRAMDLIVAHLTHARRPKLKSLTDNDGFAAAGDRLRRKEAGLAKHAKDDSERRWWFHRCSSAFLTTIASGPAARAPWCRRANP